MRLRAYELASCRPPRPPIRGSSEPAQSSVSNTLYEAISVDTLAEIPPGYIEDFHHYLRTIPFLYNDLVPSVLGRQLVTEGDVCMFFGSSVLLAVWPVALAMVPTVRVADLVLTSEKTYDSVHQSRPDASIIAYGGTMDSTAVAQIEYKGPRALEALRNVIRAWLEGTSIQIPESWNTVTRQLRKYATVTRCRSILCSDGSDAYIFVFPADESSEEVQFLQASDDGTGSLTLREAILFLIYLGIHMNSPFTLRYVYTHLCRTCWVCCCLIYCSSLELC
jgi:hypothetical protein